MPINSSASIINSAITPASLIMFRKYDWTLGVFDNVKVKIPNCNEQIPNKSQKTNSKTDSSRLVWDFYHTCSFKCILIGLFIDGFAF